MDIDADGERDGLLGEGFSDFEPMQLCHPLHASINPHFLREFLSTPDLQCLVLNPDVMWSILTNSQELSGIVFDPSSVIRVLEDVRIPGIVNEIRRLADLELGSIESIPGGLNQLRYIYEDIVEENVAAGIYENQARDQSNGSETNAGSSLPNTTPLPNPWSFTGFEGYQSNIRRSITGENEDDYLQREPVVLEPIDFSNVDSLLGGHVMANANLSTQLVQDQLQEFIPSHPEFGGRNAEQNGEADLSFLREEIQNPDFLSLYSQPETLQVRRRI
ncbi:putative ubiquilin [Medicago truncatula]|uniref:Putative ubiquilin n=1 Tax=Medicago truncatula TaxID=3880 RepID=A0A396GN90_MEDTR|nr:putative ubiquilin [Medicago truncatula]